MTIGKRIRQLRLREKISQRKLGEILGGYDKATISRWERDENDPFLDDIKKMAHYFRVSPSYILGFSDNAHNIIDLKTVQHALNRKGTVILLDGKPLSDSDKVYLNRFMELILERIPSRSNS